MITGDCEYKGFMMSQHKSAINVFAKFIKEIKPSQIIEIGTYTGGFIVAIKDIVVNNELKCDIRTYDITERSPYEKIRSLDIDVRVKNVFDKSYTKLSEDHIDEIVSFIKRSGTTLILCDGGNKINEFNILADYMKSGDFIMAHDYSETHEYFSNHIRGKIWNWCEIIDSDIEPACNKNNLHSFMHDEFKSVVWVCKQKE